MVDGFRQGVERCREILEFGGLGHTCSIHAQDRRVVEEFGLAMPACRINVNSPSTQGSIGYTTNLLPSMTLGCGTPGGNIFSDNIGPLHLINVKRIAYVNEAMLEEDERLEHQLRREYNDPRLPWSSGGGKVEVRTGGSEAPRSAPAPSSGGAFSASPLTPADIEAILQRHGR